MPRNSAPNQKKIFRAFLALLLLFGSARLYFFLTDGFNLSQIKTHFTDRGHWKHPAYSEAQLKKVNKILKQPFHYLGKGAQIYAFGSEDGKYVLKIVKQKHLQLPLWEQALTELPFFENYKKKRIEKKRSLIKRLLTSAQVCHESLQEETQLIFLHLKKGCRFHSTLSITDKLGFRYSIDPHSIEFMLQKRAVLLIPYLERLARENRQEEAATALERLVDLLIRRSKKEIADRDRRFLENVGFIEDQPLLIDLGRFEKDPEAAKPSVYLSDLNKRTRPLQSYLKRRQPLLAKRFEEILRSKR